MEIQNGQQQPPQQPIDFTSIPIESLEALRTRLNQLQLSLKKLLEQVSSSHTNYPHIVTIQNQFQVILTQLLSATQTLETNQDDLKGGNVFPLPNFPTSQQEGLLTTLLRKKPLPEVVDWFEESIKNSKEYNLKTDEEFSKWASKMLEEIKDNYEYYGFQSTEDINNENEKSDKGVAETKSDDKGMPVNDLLKFLHRGVI